MRSALCEPRRFLFGLGPEGQSCSHLASTETLRDSLVSPQGEEEGEALGVAPVLELFSALWGFLEKGSTGLGPKAALKKSVGLGWKDWASLSV